VEVMFDLLQQLNVDDASEFLEEGTPIIQNSTMRLEKSGKKLFPQQIEHVFLLNTELYLHD
jgi:hypothetical protein